VHTTPTTEHSRDLEQERKVIIELLRLLNSEDDLYSLMQEVTTHLIDYTNCEAVGIRVGDGDDYPYFETRGFPREFVEKESNLCVRDHSGRPLRNGTGNPLLECMCGNVIYGRFDPEKPYFTEYGSFWTNSTSELLASSSEEERQPHDRNRCNEAGYESVALIPLRTSDQTFGLIQLNDKRAGMFTRDRIAFLEYVGDAVSVVLALRWAEENERHTRQGYEVSQKNLVHLADKLEQIHEITDLMLGTFNENKVLHIILSAVTAGEGLGINRAILFAVDDHTSTLRGRMAVGHLDHEEAIKSWRSIHTQEMSLHDIIETYDKQTAEERNTDINQLVKKIQIPLDRTDSVLIQAVSERKIFNDVTLEGASEIDRHFIESLNLSPFTIIPLIRNEQVIGVLVVDNFITEEHIPDEYIELLKLYANHVALAIANARLMDSLEGQVKDLQHAYVTLKKHKELENLAAMGKMAAQIVHEIRNPLVSIGGFARYIRKHAVDRIPEHEEQLQIIISESTRLESILKNILTFAHPAEPNMILEDINKIIVDTMALVDQQRIDQNVESQMFLEDTDLSVRHDPEQIHQIMLNIYRNALHEMPDGGTLTTRTEFSKIHVTIRISDTGRGIPEENLPHIFDPFYTTKSTGVGLGLSIAKQIVVNHGGSIKAENAEGKGITFIISLPLERKS